MPSARIHEAVIKEMNKDKVYDELLLRIGTVAPDCWRNVSSSYGIKDKSLTHFWDYRLKNGQANGYTEFYLKYYKNLSNPFYFGYLIHLIVDQYWKTYIDPLYFKVENGIKKFKLKDGTVCEDVNNFGYHESLYMQKDIAKRYSLSILPISISDIPNFNCDIGELNLEGLFGETGTLNYINTKCLPNDEDRESKIYDTDKVIEHIKETVIFVTKELDNLSKIKNDYEKSHKIAIDINSLITISEGGKLYINDDVKNISDYLIWLLDNNYKIDILVKNEYSKYRKQIIELLDINNIKYSYLHIVYENLEDYLKEHDYEVIISDNLESLYSLVRKK